MDLLLMAGTPPVFVTDFSAVDGRWTALLGTPEVVGGALRAAAMTLDAYNLVQNPELTTNTDGYFDTACLLTRVDSAIDPGASSVAAGALNDWVLRVEASGAGSGTGYEVIPAVAIVGSGAYRLSALSYSPSANANSNAARMFSSTHLGGQNLRTAVQDAWAELAFDTTAVAAPADPLAQVQLRTQTTTAGDKTYWDRVWLQLYSMLLVHRHRSANVQIDSEIIMPAVATTPRAIVFRVADSLNYWRVRVQPNVAGTDLWLEYVEDGAIVPVDSADIDWTADDTDELRVACHGTTIIVSHRKSGAAVWTDAITALGMTFNQTAQYHGVQLFGTADAAMSSYRCVHASNHTIGAGIPAFLIGGQSNASGRHQNDYEASDPNVFALGNDYIFRVAEEPLDSNINQVDTVSSDSTAGHSFGVRAGKMVIAGSPADAILIPCPLGGSTIDAWLPGANRLDRSTLYGSANYRRSLFNNVAALLWHGHEQNRDDADYVTKWTQLVSEWRTDVPGVPMIYVQLQKNVDATYSHDLHLTAEKQRLMETGSGDASEIVDHHMVVAFDLPLVDNTHINSDGMKILGDRYGLAIREHVFGEAVNGTGPRLVSITQPSADTVKVKTTMTLAVIAADADNQFRAFDDAVEATITSVVRDPADDTAALITLDANVVGTMTVSYGDVVASGTGVTYANVVKDGDGLPLPQFGAQGVSA